jgi:hypothetical protein
VALAAQRLDAFRTGLRDNNYCPDTSDIVDLTVERSNGTILIPYDGEVPGLPRDNVPDRPHWVSVDLTNPPGPWNPRRTDWQQIIVDQDFTDETAAALTAQAQSDLVAQEHVVSLLQGVTLSATGPSGDFASFATTKIPFGLWQPKTGCKFARTDCDHGFCGKLGDYDGKTPSLPHERWMDLATSTANNPITPDSAVYSAIPGSLIFNMICVNCHGPDADSSGRQAQTLAEMTGGTARVADFRDGLFGPFGSGGTNRKSIFGSDDVAARYLPWMALGGTNVKIPLPILNLVANTPVLGVSRRGISVNSANMLQTGQALCTLVGQMTLGTFDPSGLHDPTNQAALHGNISLISSNGDAELWTRLCEFNNPPPIHALLVSAYGGGAANGGGFNLQFPNTNLFFAAKYPANTPVGDGAGDVQPSLTPDDDTPWCVLQPTDSDSQAWLTTQHAADGNPLPVCPAPAVTEDNRFKAPKDANGQPLRGDIDDWAARGAINAGQAVFVYLDQMISQGKGRDLTYDECDQLAN